MPKFKFTTYTEVIHEAVVEADDEIHAHEKLKQLDVIFIKFIRNRNSGYDVEEIAVQDEG